MNSRLLRSVVLASGGLLSIYGSIYGAAAKSLAGAPLGAEQVAQLHATRNGMIAAGIAIAGLGWLASRRSSPAPAWLLPAWLLAWTTIVPLAVLELSLRPFHPGFEERVGDTRLFVPDGRLGWKLRPGARASWCKREVSINAKGLVGPEVDYERDGDALRILFLGDSVTFGYCMPSYRDAFPYRTAGVLERALGQRVEVVNAGVGGYSPWQEYLYLESEGVRYAPDLVVIGFVENDIAEKLDLARFGGSSDGFQLARSALSGYDALSRRSALVYFARLLGGSLRFGSDAQRGAVDLEAAQMRSLRAAGELNDPEQATRLAVKLTLGNLERIVASSRAHDIPVLLAIFPTLGAMQEARGGRASSARAVPRLLLDFARRSRIHVVDLEPEMLARFADEGRAPRAYMIDEVHPSRRGHALVAEILADRILRGGLPGARTATREAVP